MNIDDELLLDVSKLAHYVRRPSYFAANGFYWAVAAAMALAQLGMGPLYWLLSAVWDIDPAGYATAMQMLLYLGAMLLPLWAYVLARPGEREAFRLQRPEPAQLLLAVIAAGFGFFAANFTTTVWMILLEQLGYSAPAVDAFTGSLPLDLIMIALLPGVCEEFLFRGMIMGAYERRGTWKAIWISALLFTGLHGSVAGLPAQLMLGVALGFAAASTGSIAVPMALHAAYNAITVAVSYSAPEDVASGLTLLEQVGGWAGVMVSAVLAMASLALFVLALRLLDRLRVRENRPFGNDALLDRLRLSPAEITLLLSGVVTVGWFYLQNILGI